MKSRFHIASVPGGAAAIACVLLASILLPAYTGTATAQVPGASPPALAQPPPRGFMDGVAAGSIAPRGSGFEASRLLPGEPVYEHGGIVWSRMISPHAAPRSDGRLAGSSAPRTTSALAPSETAADAPQVLITNAPTAVGPAALTNGVELSGIQSGVVGEMWYFNAANATLSRFPVPQTPEWVMTITNLEIGVNRVSVWGQDAQGTQACDAATIIIDARYAAIPDVWFTTADPVDLPAPTDSIVLNGENNPFAVGDKPWFNGRTGQRGIITGTNGTPWSLEVTGLRSGPNPIYVVASNAYGDLVYDTILVNRAYQSDSPWVLITDTPSPIGDWGVLEGAWIYGTISNTTGSLLWHNAANDAQQYFLPDTPSYWGAFIPGSFLTLGTNLITVRATGTNGVEVWDSTVLLVGDAYESPTMVTITNDSPMTVPYGATHAFIGGSSAFTSGSGFLFWSNALTGGSHFFTTPAPVIPEWTAEITDLDFGRNEIYVFAVDAPAPAGSSAPAPQGAHALGLGDPSAGSWAHITIARDYPPGDALVVITSAPPASLPYDIDSLTLSGTNSDYVVGDMWWVSSAGAQTGRFSRTGTSWAVVVPGLPRGPSVITVYGTNVWGYPAMDAVSILRDWSPGAPAIAITSEPPARVAYDVTSALLSGTNNAFVTPPLVWRNTPNGQTGSVGTATFAPIGGLWSVAVTDLQRGQNVIDVIATNSWDEVAYASVTIDRDWSPGAPVIAITNDTPSNVAYDVASVILCGTNNDRVTAPMWWVNATNSASGTFASTGGEWSITVPVANGLNTIYVYATNEWDELSYDVVSLQRAWSPGLPFLAITNDTPTNSISQSTFVLSGTNNDWVVGRMWWLNLRTGLGAEFTPGPGGQWAAAASGLAYGENPLYVFGTNRWNELAWDVVTVTRTYPGGTRFVSPAGAESYPYTNLATAARTIQAAIDAAGDGELVLVDDGLYGLGTRSLPGQQVQNRVILDKPVRVESLNGRQFAVIQGGGDGVLNRIRCVTVSGGGTLAGFTLQGGQAAALTTPDEANGGCALVLPGGTISNCLVTGGWAAGAGGGVYCRGGSVQDCDIRENTAPSAGGVWASSGVVERCTVEENVAAGPAGGARGAAAARFINCVITRNHAATRGGGLVMDDASVEALHCTISANTSAAEAGGLDASSGGQVRNSIVAGNSCGPGISTPDVLASGATFEFCCVPVILPGPGNISAPPGFAADGSLRLSAGSPCIDAFPGPGGLTVDRAGVARPLDGNSDGSALNDLGAYEFVDPTVDTDHDQMPDAWEIGAGLDPTSSLGIDGSGGDPDGDGMKNYDEMVADTDPLNGDSILEIVSIDRSADEIRITVRGGVHARRFLQYRPGGTPPGAPWINVATNIAPSPVTNVLYHSGSPDPASFYRIQVEHQ